MTWVTIPTVNDGDFVDMPYWRMVWNNLLHLKNKLWEIADASTLNTTVTVTSSVFADISTRYIMEFDCKGDRPVLIGVGFRWSDTVGDNANLGSILFLVDDVAVTAATNGTMTLLTTVGDSFGEMRVITSIIYPTEGHHTFKVQAKQHTGSTGNMLVLFNNANPQMWAVEL